NNSSPIRSKARTTLMRASPSRSCKRDRYFAVMAIDQHQIDEPLGEGRGSDAGQHLDVGELVGDFLRAGDKTDAQAAGQRLGKAARINHAVELVERREARRCLDL